MNSAAIKVVEETIYTDGSGSCGLYEVGGIRFYGIHNGEKVTVGPVKVGTSFRSWREKKMVQAAAKAVELRIYEVVGGAGAP